MSEKTCVITGATRGIGLRAAIELGKLGWRLVLVGRNEQRANDALAAVRKASGNDRVETALADLSSLAEIRRLAGDLLERCPRIDVLLNNAGLMLAKRQTTVDGYETTFAVNHLGYFLLTNLLLDRLEESAPARIVNVASGAHHGVSLDFDDLMSARYPRGGYAPYKKSKLANILFTRDLARRLEGTGVTANSLHPGFVASGFNHNNGLVASLAMRLMRPFMISVERGAATPVYLASSPDVQGVTGQYFYECREAKPSRQARDDGTARRLWEISEQLTGPSDGG